MSFFCDNCDAKMPAIKTVGTLRYRRCTCGYRCWTEEIARDDLPTYQTPGRPVLYKRKTYARAG